jgi:hypothetical protein
VLFSQVGEVQGFVTLKWLRFEGFIRGAGEAIGGPVC